MSTCGRRFSPYGSIFCGIIFHGIIHDFVTAPSSMASLLLHLPWLHYCSIFHGIVFHGIIFYGIIHGIIHGFITAFHGGFRQVLLRQTEHR